MNKASRFSLIALVLASATLQPGVSRAASQVHVGSNTIFRFFEQDRPNSGNSKQGVPGYEYLQIDAGKLDADGLSVHAYGWGRYDFGDFFEDSSAGEFLYGYAQYAQSANNVLVRAGRQRVFEGVADETVDGLRVGSDLTPFFAVSAYGGQPVSLEEVNGRGGDSIWGGRFAHRLFGYYEVGVSYKRIANDGDREAAFVGIDSVVTPSGGLLLQGRSSRNLVNDQWGEHSYEARITVAPLVLRPFFQKLDYDGFFDTGKDTGGPFRFLRSSKEQVAVVGGDAIWQAKAVEFQAKLKHFDYKERDEAAWYYAGLATLHGKGLSQLGGEVGRMEGDTDQNRYTLLRGYLYWDNDSSCFASGDVVYAKYDRSIYGKDNSIFVSVGGGTKLLAKSLNLKLSGDYSSDPYFESDIRGTIVAEYVFDSK